MMEIPKDDGQKRNIGKRNDEKKKIYQIKDVPGYPGFKADTDGKIYSSFGREVGSEVKFGKNKGYYVIKTLDGYKGRHQLVCLAFHGEPPSILHEVGHINDIHGDDRPENLCWVTRTQNEISKVRNLKSKNAKLTIEKVIEIRRLHEEGKDFDFLSKRFGTSVNNIRHIVFRRTWDHC